MKPAPYSTSYEPFSREPEYIDCNRRFVESLGLHASRPVLDLACGTGTLTELVLSAVPGARVLGLDLSRESLALGAAHLEDTGLRGLIGLVEGSADCLPVAAGGVGAVVMGNAVQLVDDKDQLFREIHRVLAPGGLFACNTSFYAGTYVPGTERFYVQWIAEASNYIKRRSDELAARGLPGIARRRGTVDRASSRPWLSAADYGAFLTRQGFAIRSTVERTVMLNQRCFETIGSYAGLASVLLSGYPVPIACEALEQASGPALRAFGRAEVPRHWLEIVATRP